MPLGLINVGIKRVVLWLQFMHNGVVVNVLSNMV
jgi:hypothetical protein